MRNRIKLSFAFFVILSGTFFYTQEKPLPVFEGLYFGQTPPGIIPQRFAAGFLSTEGYDITPTFSPALDEVFFGSRPTEDGSDNKLYYSRMVNGRWQKPALASFLSDGLGFEAWFSVAGNSDIYWVEAKVIKA